LWFPARQTLIVAARPQRGVQSTQVTFGMEREEERPFLEAYMIDAWDRFEDHEAVESAWFWRFGSASEHDPVELEDGTVLEHGGVILVVNGDPNPDPAIDQERERWEILADEGLLDTWECKGFQPEYENARQKMIENFGQRGGELNYRLRPLATRTTLGLLETFDEDLPAVGKQTEENPVPVGAWVLIHFLLKQSGYDWYEEIDACQQAIRNRLRSLAQFHGTATAEEELDTVIEELDALRGELDSERQ
jgi:hypothetical protein